MSMHRSFAASLWLLAAAGAYAVVVAWADDARSGKIPPWTLVVLFWGVALVSVIIHHLSHYLSDHFADAPDALSRYWTRWRLGVRLGARRLAGQRLRSRQAVARSDVPTGSSAHSGKAPSWTLVVFLNAAATVSVAIQVLAQAPGALRQAWTQGKAAARLQVGQRSAQTVGTLKR